MASSATASTSDVAKNTTKVTASTSDVAKNTAKVTTKELKEEEKELIKQFFTGNIRPFEEFISLIDRIPTFVVIFLSRFYYCRRSAVDFLTITNSIYAVLFASRLLLCSETIEYDYVFYIERVAFVFAALFYNYEFLICGTIASALYFFTNSLMIKSILEQADDWADFLTIFHKKYRCIIHGPDFSSDEETESDSGHNGDEFMPELENEPPPKEEVEQQNQETPEEAKTTLRKDLGKKTYEHEYNDHIYVSDEETDVDVAEEEEEAKEEEYPELGEHKVDLHRRELLLLLKEYKQHCVELENEKNSLSLKLQDKTKALEHCAVIQKDNYEHQIMWNEEKRQLTEKIDEQCKTLTYYQHMIQEHVIKNSNNSTSSVADDSLSQLQANLASTRASLFDCQKRYQNSIHESEEKRLKWESERNELNANLSAISSWYQYYVLATCDYQLQNHNLLVERDDLSAKLHSANTSVEFYKACLDDCDEECRKLREEIGSLSSKLFSETSSVEQYHNVVRELEEKNKKLEDEKNELVAKLSAAKATSSLYRSYLHDVGSS